MTKTSTSKHNANLSGTIVHQSFADAERDLEIASFYDGIKGQLDELAKDPQDETIARILTHSRSL
ncbi:hypothetical protein [Pedobacter sp. MW01-1-1]|uniref:hypothetical protein n=1 Tax=Pedobacter sp. MW01-1-1 TaxID=3383027 RepID=UPI003FEF50CE